MKRKTKRILKTVLGCVLGIGAVIGLGALISNISTKDDEIKEIHPKFEVGGLNDDGKYEETKLSLYTKESFDCNGLKITTDFDSNIEYQVYFYNENDVYVPTEQTVYTEGKTFDVPYDALKARIVITPIWSNDVEEKDKELGLFDILKYSNQLTITVSETQYKTFVEKEIEVVGISFDYNKNLFSSDGLGKLGASGTFEADSTSPWAYDTLDTTGYLYLVLRIPTDTYYGTLLRNGSEQPACSIYKYIPTNSTVYTTATTEIIFENSSFVYLKMELSETIKGLGITVDNKVVDKVKIFGF